MSERRLLHPELQAALDSMSAADIRILVKLAFEHDADERSAQDGWLTRLLDGLAMQVTSDAAMTRAKSDAVLHALEADHRAYVDEIDLRANGPLPQREGVPATFDPDTGEFSPT